MNISHRHSPLYLVCLIFIVLAAGYAVADDSLVVTDIGNVGIGRTYPTAKLHVDGSVLFTSGNNTVKIADMGNLQSWGGNGLGLRVGYNVYHVGGVGDAYVLPGHKASMLTVGQTGGRSGDLEFWTSDTVATTANETLTDWSAKMVVRSNGNVGIGTSSPEAKLHVFGGSLLVSDKNQYGDRSDSAIITDSILPNADKGLRIYDGNSNYHISIDVFGTAEIQAYGQALADAEEPSEYMNLGLNPKGGHVGVNTISPLYPLDVNGIIRGDNVAPSDARWKENVGSIDGALERVAQLRGVTYSWVDPSRGDGPQIGVIAQEVEEIFPEVVHTDSQGYKSVAYAKLVAPLIEAVKELKKKNERLEQRNSEFERRLAAIEAMLAK